MKIKIFLTFDHELPLGGLQTSYENALFKPTQKVLEVADRCGVKVTLFSDILCAYKYQMWDSDGFYNPYKQQIQATLLDGHDVQLHIHPHWLTSAFDETSFIPSSDFSLSDFANDTAYGGIDGIIKHAIAQLNAICKSTIKDYRCVAYRAGGYNVAPNTQEIINSLYKHGIHYDSSMAKGYYFKSGISTIDFRNLPHSPNWIIDPTNYRKALVNKPGIYEIPIATCPKSFFELPTAFKMKKYAHRAAENRGRMIHDHHPTDWVSKINQLLSARMLSFDNHTFSVDYLLRMVDYQIKQYRKQSNEILFSVVSHPKSMGNYALELMENFILTAKKQYPEVEFMTFSQLYMAE